MDNSVYTVDEPKLQVTPSWKESSVSGERAAFKRDLSEVGEGPTGTPAGSTATCHQDPVTSCIGEG